MIKKLIIALAVILTFSHCSDDDKTLAPAPEVSDVLIEGASGDNPLQIEEGETIMVSLILKEQSGVTYRWLLDGQEVGNTEKLTHKFDKVGSYKLAVVLTNEDGISTTKEIGTVTAVHQIPVITQFMLDGKEIVGEVGVTATSELSFSIVVEKAEGADYSWTINGTEIVDEKSMTLKYTLGLSGTLKVTLTNKDKVAVSKEIELVGPYKDGAFVFGTTNSALTFISETGVQTSEHNNLYEALNSGEKMGDGGINDFQIYNNKIYMLLPMISYQDQRGQLIVADAQTLKKIETITAEGFNSKTLGTIYNLNIVSDDKAYIGSNNIMSGNTSSVKVLDIKEKKMSDSSIEGTEGKMGTEGPSWARMLNLESHTLIACGAKLQVVSHATDKVDKTLSFEAGQVTDVLKGRNNKIYALVNGGENEAAFVATIDATTYEIENRTSLIYNSKSLKLKGGMGSSQAAVSPISDEIFFCVAGANSWSSNSEIYKYNYASKNVSLFVDATDAVSSSAINGYMGVDAKGTLFVPVSGEWTYQSESIIGYNIKSDGSDYKEYERLGQGEGNVMPTWMKR